MKKDGKLPSSYREKALEKTIEGLQNRLNTSRNMLRNLYRKYVQVEKEHQIRKVSTQKREPLDGGKGLDLEKMIVQPDEI